MPPFTIWQMVMVWVLEFCIASISVTSHCVYANASITGFQHMQLSGRETSPAVTAWVLHAALYFPAASCDQLSLAYSCHLPK